MTLFFDDFETLGQYHDFWAHVLFNAPDRFTSFDDTPVNQKETLAAAFNALRSGFRFVERKITDTRKLRIMRELIEMSYEAYVAGDSKTGAHTLQECEGMIWKSRTQSVKYAVAAELRAFGKLETYANVKVSPYPFEGTEDDLTPHMITLYTAARQRCLDKFSEREDFKPFILLLDIQGIIQEHRSRSWKSSKTQIQSLATNSLILGFVRTEICLSGISGVLIHDIEVINSPRVSIRSRVSDYVCESPPHFHFDATTVLQQHE